MSVPSGWYPDPAATGTVRWWDGQTWTSHTAPALGGPVADPATDPDPFAPPQGYGSEQDHRSPGNAEPQTTGSHSSGPAGGSRGWLLPAVAVGLVLILAAAGVLGYRNLHGSASTPDAASTPAALAPALSAAAAATLLEGFKPHDDTPAPGMNSTLVAKGDGIATPTLTGWCAATFATEKSRIARRQWVFMRAGRSAGASVEVVAYATTAQARSAFTEFAAVTAACSKKVDSSSQGTATYSTLSVRPLTPAASEAQGLLAILSEDVVLSGDPTTVHGSMAGVLQQRGQFLSVIWSGQQVPYSAADLAVLDTVATAQAKVLATVPLS